MNLFMSQTETPLHMYLINDNNLITYVASEISANFQCFSQVVLKKEKTRKNTEIIQCMNRQKICLVTGGKNLNILFFPSLLTVIFNANSCEHKRISRR